MTKEDKYNIIGDAIQCISASGNEYTITADSCSCKGFGFRRKCRHLETADKLGLFKELEKQKNCKSPIDFYNSPLIISVRKDAIKKYLNKYNIKSSSKLIDELNTFITADTKPQEVFEFCETFKKD